MLQIDWNPNSRLQIVTQESRIMIQTKPESTYRSTLDAQVKIQWYQVRFTMQNTVLPAKGGIRDRGTIGVGRRKKRGFGGVISPERTFDIPVACPYQSALVLQHHLQL